MNDKTEIYESCGNVFKDLGCDDADELLVKSELIAMISSVIRQRGLKVTQAAKLIGVSHSRISQILSGEHFGYSISRLIRFLRALHVDIQIIMKDRESDLVRSTVVQAA